MNKILLSIFLFIGSGCAAHAAFSLDLSWNDNSDNETGFKIERSTDAADFEEIAQVLENVERYTDATIPEGSTVSYRVRAFNQFGDSGYTNEAKIKAARPNPPSGLKLLKTLLAAAGALWFLFAIAQTPTT